MQKSKIGKKDKTEEILKYAITRFKQKCSFRCPMLVGYKMNITEHKEIKTKGLKFNTIHISYSSIANVG